MIIDLEATSVYGDNLVYFLRKDASLVPYDRKIHVLNPNQAKNFKKAYNDLPKNDYMGSYVIADYLRFSKINKEVYQGDYRYKPFRTSQRHASSLSKASSGKNRVIISVLFKKYSTMTQEKVFTDTFSMTVLAVYEEFDSAETLTSIDLHEFTRFIMEK